MWRPTWSFLWFQHFWLETHIFQLNQQVSISLYLTEKNPWTPLKLWRCSECRNAVAMESGWRSLAACGRSSSDVQRTCCSSAQELPDRHLSWHSWPLKNRRAKKPISRQQKHIRHYKQTRSPQCRSTPPTRSLILYSHRSTNYYHLLPPASLTPHILLRDSERRHQRRSIAPRSRRQHPTPFGKKEAFKKQHRQLTDPATPEIDTEFPRSGAEDRRKDPVQRHRSSRQTPQHQNLAPTKKRHRSGRSTRATGHRRRTSQHRKPDITEPRPTNPGKPHRSGRSKRQAIPTTEHQHRSGRSKRQAIPTTEHQHRSKFRAPAQ